MAYINLVSLFASLLVLCARLSWFILEVQYNLNHAQIGHPHPFNRLSPQVHENVYTEKGMAKCKEKLFYP